MQRKGTRVNPILGDQSGIPISHLRARARRKGTKILARRKTSTTPTGRIVSFNLGGFSGGVKHPPGVPVATATPLRPVPLIPSSVAGASIWPTGGAFVSVTKVGTLFLDGGLLSQSITKIADGGTVAQPPVGTTVLVRDGGKAA